MHAFLIHRLKRLKRGTLARLALYSPRFTPLLYMPVPLSQKKYGSGMQSKTLLIFLPGIGDIAEDFERQGFIDDLRRHDVVVDAVAVDAHYGYYSSAVIHERITEDVIAAAHAAGYERIWLAGVSLGGFGAATYAARHTSHVAGLLLFAPYLGSPTFIKEVADAGGIEKWEPGPVSEGDHQRALWRWFKHHYAYANGTPSVPLYLGYGARDMFAGANALLADVLPQDQVFSISGGHDWRTWKKIWQMFLDEAPGILT
jgi:pimeloyl-ACP methyl ester carboxylesterase